MAAKVAFALLGLWSFYNQISANRQLKDVGSLQADLYQARKELKTLKRRGSIAQDQAMVNLPLIRLQTLRGMDTTAGPSFEVTLTEYQPLLIFNLEAPAAVENGFTCQLEDATGRLVWEASSLFPTPTAR